MLIRLKKQPPTPQKQSIIDLSSTSLPSLYNNLFPPVQQMAEGRKLLILTLIIILSKSQIITNLTSNQSTLIISQTNPVMFTIVDDVKDLSDVQAILSQLAVPGFSRKHGYNYVSLNGWSCNKDFALPVKIWQNPNQYINNTFSDNITLSRMVIKQFYEAAGVKLLLNVFGTQQNPVSSGLDPVNCSNKLISFLKSYNFDGMNIDFQDKASLQTSNGLTWLTQFMINLKNYGGNFIISHSVDINTFNSTLYPGGDYSLIQKTVGSSIKFYNFRYFNDINNQYLTVQQIFFNGKLSVNFLIGKGIPLNKIVVGKPSIYNQTGYLDPNTLLQYFKLYYHAANWWGGAMFQPYIYQQAKDETRFLTLKRDNNEVISSVNLDTVNFWWPPQKTVADIGVPGYAPDNMYNYFIFGTWTCKYGAFDISKLWSDASFYLSTNFGNNTSGIQTYLKSKYQSKGKRILTRAFGNAQSPTSSNLSPSICATSLATYIQSNNLDGVDINYQDNVAFNSATAENWLIQFTSNLRNLLPFHIITHTIQDYLLDHRKYVGGSYQRVIATIGSSVDFYHIAYYGQQHTNFTTYQQIFIDSGSEFPNISVTQLITQGFQLNKIVIAKPINLFDAKGSGYIDPLPLREVFLEANINFSWQGGICYSSFISDEKGTNLMLLLRGINNTDSKRFAYVENANVWWPPTSTIAQMGVPTFASPNIYNYFAYSFWTCLNGSTGLAKVYDDPLTYFGVSNLGKNKPEVQEYIKSLYQKQSIKLLVSAFGAGQFPVKEGLDPVYCGKKFAEFVSNNSVDGVDIDFEDSQAFVNGTGEWWVNTFTRQVRSALPFHIVSHAPQAPYFSPQFSKTGSYLTIHSKVGRYIDFYNVQFYNQGNTTYSDYQGLFVNSGKLNPNTSIFQIISQGVQASKIVMGKPVSKNDAYNTGVVPAATLRDLIAQAKKDPNNPGWQPSLMVWQYLSDLDGKFVSTVMK